MSKSKRIILSSLRKVGALPRKTVVNPYSRIRVSRVVLPFPGYKASYSATSQHLIDRHKKVET